MKRREALLLPLVAAVGLVAGEASAKRGLLLPTSFTVKHGCVIANGVPFYRNCDYEDVRLGRLTEQQAAMFHCLKPGQRYVELTGISLKTLVEIQAKFAETKVPTLVGGSLSEKLRISSLTAGGHDGETWARFMIEETA